jgi:enterochelin esterase-like enzyme
MAKNKIIYIFYMMTCILLFTFGCISSGKKYKGIESSKVIKKTFKSKSLKKDMNINIYLPKMYNKSIQYPVLYLIHGYSDNEDKWIPNLQLEKVADRLIENNQISPLIIVMPQIDNSFGINTSNKKNFSSNFSSGQYEDYIYKDLVSYIDKKYSTIKNRDGRYIGGLSMGGWAALHTAFIHIDMFSKVGGHSPAFINETWLFPTLEIRNERDPIYIASKKDLTKLKVYLDCGDRDDFKFYEGCEKLFVILQANGVSSEYHLNSGKHNDEYWKLNLEKYLLFYAGK